MSWGQRGRSVLVGLGARDIHMGGNKQVRVADTANSLRVGVSAAADRALRCYSREINCGTLHSVRLLGAP